MNIQNILQSEINLPSIAKQIKYLTNAIDIQASDCVFVMVDIQEKFRGIIHELETVSKNSDILNRSAEILDIPMLITEQYPQRLGKTLTEIYKPANAACFEKSKFSIFTEEVTEYLNTKHKPVLVVYGIEAHICITQTCLEAVKESYHVILVADAVSSRKQYSKDVALNMLSQKGVEIVTTEMLLFRFLKDAKHPNFKEISKLIK